MLWLCNNQIDSCAIETINFAENFYDELFSTSKLTETDVLYLSIMKR